MCTWTNDLLLLCFGFVKWAYRLDLSHRIFEGRKWHNPSKAFRAVLGPWRACNNCEALIKATFPPLPLFMLSFFHKHLWSTCMEAGSYGGDTRNIRPTILLGFQLPAVLLEKTMPQTPGSSWARNALSPTCSCFIFPGRSNHLFIQQMFIKHILCSACSAKCWGGKK